MDFAYTKDGKQCNECGKPILYLAKESVYVHEEAAPDCSAAKRIAAVLAEHERKRAL